MSSTPIWTLACGCWISERSLLSSLPCVCLPCRAVAAVITTTIHSLQGHPLKGAHSLSTSSFMCPFSTSPFCVPLIASTDPRLPGKRPQNLIARAHARSGHVTRPERRHARLGTGRCATPACIGCAGAGWRAGAGRACWVDLHEFEVACQRSAHMERLHVHVRSV